MANPGNMPTQPEEVRFAAAVESLVGDERRLLHRISDAAGVRIDGPRLLQAGLRWGVGQEASEAGVEAESIRRQLGFTKLTSVERRFRCDAPIPDDPLAGKYS